MGIMDHRPGPVGDQNDGGVFEAGRNLTQLQRLDENLNNGLLLVRRLPTRIGLALNKLG